MRDIRNEQCKLKYICVVEEEDKLLMVPSTNGMWKEIKLTVNFNFKYRKTD